MHALENWIFATSDFLESGGPVMKVLVWIILLCWVLIFERLFYYRFSHGKSIHNALAYWLAREEPQAWHSEQIRDAMLSRLRESAYSSVPMIKTLVALCPLLGLLGTVTGMIAIFDVMALKGTGNARSMAEGVSRATIPTMAGMVGALAGVLGATLVGRRYDRLLHRARALFQSDPIAKDLSYVTPEGKVAKPTRTLVALVLAVFVTAGLLSVMQILIKTGKKSLTETELAFVVDFVRVPKQETLERKKRRVEKPQEVEAPPEFEQPRQASLDDSMLDNTVGVSVPEMDSSVADANLSGFSGFGSSDGDYLPIVKVAPNYPYAALVRGLEGYVIVEFTVTRQGTVKDPVVVESSSRIFEKAALEAALKFKYKPRVVSGQAIEVRGVMNRITFQLVDGKGG